MLDKVKELINRPHVYVITFKYETYGNIIVTCSVKRPYHKHLATQAVGGSEEEALNKALELLEQVKTLEQKVKIEQPSLDKQKYVGGYYREKLFEDYEVEFKRTGDSYVITNISRKDEYGFYIVEEPYEPTEKIFKLDKAEFHGTEVAKYRELLKEGEELYAWDNIGYLCGSAGLLVVKDGKIVKSKGIAMA